MSAEINVPLITTVVSDEHEISYINDTDVYAQLSAYLVRSGVDMTPFNDDDTEHMHNVGRVIYGKGIMHFYNCVTIFFSKHLRKIGNRDGTTFVILYDKHDDELSYPSSGIEDIDDGNHMISYANLHDTYDALLSAWTDVYENDN